MEEKEPSKFTINQMRLEALKSWQGSKIFSTTASREMRLALKQVIRELEPSKSKKK